MDLILVDHSDLEQALFKSTKAFLTHGDITVINGSTAAGGVQVTLNGVSGNLSGRFFAVVGSNTDLQFQEGVVAVADECFQL